MELSSKKKKVSWPSDPDDEVEDDLEKTLELRQVGWEREGEEGGGGRGREREEREVGWEREGEGERRREREGEGGKSVW